jgi:1-acyl-sn-glycerol-3-phosphate acyltransferase
MEFLSLLAIIFGYFDKTGNLSNQCGILWSKLLLKLSRAEVIVQGAEKLAVGGPFVIVSNHQSAFDIFILMGRLPINFKWILKKELLKIPIFGKALQAARYISIDRDNAREALNGIKNAAAMLDQGVSVAVFPEGTRSHDGKLNEFKRGAFILSTKTKRPILPVSLDGSYKIIGQNKMIHLGQKVILQIYDPIEVENLSAADKKQLAERVRTLIAENLTM